METLLSSDNPSLLQSQLPKGGSESMQIYYKHGMDEDANGYYAAHATGWYWSDIPNLDYDQLSIILQYMGNPMYQTAKRLLQSQNIQVPLHALLHR